MSKIYLEDVMEKANEKYNAVKQHTNFSNHNFVYSIQSDQVKALAEALVDAVNKALEVKNEQE